MTQRNSEIVRVGVISDTHGLLRPEATAELGGSDFLIHAGDVGDPEILEELSRIAPLTTVRGNVDRGSWAKRLPKTQMFALNKTFIYVLHDLSDLDLSPGAAGIAAVVSGHSHVAVQSTKDGVLYFNPGSAGPRRFKLPVTIGKITIIDGKVQSEIVELKI